MAIQSITCGHKQKKVITKVISMQYCEKFCVINDSVAEKKILSKDHHQREFKRQEGQTDNTPRDKYYNWTCKGV